MECSSREKTGFWAFLATIAFLSQFFQCPSCECIAFEHFFLDSHDGFHVATIDELARYSQYPCRAPEPGEILVGGILPTSQLPAYIHPVSRNLASRVRSVSLVTPISIKGISFLDSEMLDVRTTSTCCTEMFEVR